MRKLLSLLAVVSLLLGSMPAFAIAQSQPNGDNGGRNRALLPFVMAAQPPSKSMRTMRSIVVSNRRALVVICWWLVSGAPAGNVPCPVR